MQTLLSACCARFTRCVALALALAATSVMAAPMPNATRPVSITAREQPIAAFLQDLFAAVDVPAAVSPGLAGTVNGTFTGPAEKVLRDVARVYNLVPYFDGTVMHVVPASEIDAPHLRGASSTLAERALREVSEQNLTDARNSLRRSTDGNLLAVGTRRFIEQVDEMLRASQVQQATPSVPPGAADFRVFYLRYAWAHDVTTTVGGRQVVLPGVASILRSLVGVRGGAALGREVALKPTLPSLKGQGLAGQGASTQCLGRRRGAECVGRPAGGRAATHRTAHRRPAGADHRAGRPPDPHRGRPAPERRDRA